MIFQRVIQRGRVLVVGTLICLTVAGCAREPQAVPMLHGWCVLKTEGRIEGMASVAGRPVLSSPVVGKWGPGLIGRAILQRMNGTASLMCSRPPNGPNRCVLTAVSPDDGYGFGDFALEAVKDLDIPSDPEGTPVRVDFAFTLAEPRTTTCD